MDLTLRAGLIFLNQPYMFRATNSPILRSTLFDSIYSFWYNAPTVLPTGVTVEMELTFHLNRGTGRQQYRCIVKKSCILVYSQKEGSWEWANLSPETCRADLRRLINERVVASCWLLTSLDLKCSRIRCWGRYLGLRGRKWRETGENRIRRSFIYCILVLFTKYYAGDHLNG